MPRNKISKENHTFSKDKRMIANYFSELNNYLTLQNHINSILYTKHNYVGKSLAVIIIVNGWEIVAEPFRPS